MTDKKDLTDEIEPEAREAGEALHELTSEGCGEDASLYAGAKLLEVDDAKPRRRKLLIVVALIVLAFVSGLVAAGYWAHLQLERFRAELAQVTQDTSAQSQAMLDSHAQQQSELVRQQLDAQTTVVETRVGEVGSALDTLNLRLTEAEQSQPHALVMAETEYLLNLAGNRLTLEHDRTGALLALDRALARLSEADAAVYAILLATISAERASLSAVEVPDLASIVSRVSSLVVRVDELAIDSEKLTPDAQTPVDGSLGEQGWRAVASSITANLSQFVTIERADGVGPPTLIPDQDYYARENARLALKSARSAAVRRDTANFRFALTDATRWLSHLAGKDASVSDMLGEIESLIGIDLDVRYPRLTGSLSVARQLSAGVDPDIVESAHDADSDDVSDTGLDSSAEPAIVVDESAGETMATDETALEAAVTNDSTSQATVTGESATPESVDGGEVLQSLESVVEEVTGAVNELDESLQ